MRIGERRLCGSSFGRMYVIQKFKLVGHELYFVEVREDAPHIHLSDPAFSTETSK